jgi:hypothetical protein
MNTRHNKTIILEITRVGINEIYIVDHSIHFIFKTYEIFLDKVLIFVISIKTNFM